MFVRKRISLAAILLVVVFMTPWAYADTKKQLEPLRDVLPCKAPDGEYPYMVIEYNSEKNVAFFLKCESQGEPWKLMTVANTADKPEQKE